MRPLFMVTSVDGSFTGPGGKALQLTVTQHDWAQLDEFHVLIDDRDAALQPPALDTSVQIFMGYQETGTVDMGLFRINKVEFDGWGRLMLIEGTSHSVEEQAKERRTQDYQGKTRQEVGEMIAERNNLTPFIMGTPASKIYNYLLQHDESDFAFITRLARDNGMTGKIANGMLYMVEKGMAVASSGVLLSQGVARFPDNVKAYSAVWDGREYYNASTGQYTYPQNQEVKQAETPGSASPAVPATTPTAKHNISPMQGDGEQGALNAGQGAQSYLDAQVNGTLDMELIGDPTIAAAQWLTVEQVREFVDGQWWMNTVTHTINNTGYTTVVHCDKWGLGATPYTPPP